jgi:hypothetical protein
MASHSTPRRVHASIARVGRNDITDFTWAGWTRPCGAPDASIA